MKHLLVAVALLVPSLAVADPEITDLTVKAISKIDGKIYELDKLPEDDGGSYAYGGDMQLVVGVGLQGESTAKSASALTVELKTPGFSSEATGKVKAVKSKQKRSITSYQDKRWEFFLFDRPCDKATFTAKLGKSSKQVNLELFCAE
jgi:hypothetical protein